MFHRAVKSHIGEKGDCSTIQPLVVDEENPALAVEGKRPNYSTGMHERMENT